MNEATSKDPLYIEIFGIANNRCLTCYKEDKHLLLLTEQKFLKMFVPEITLTDGDRVCEDCDSMLKKMIRFRDTVLTAQQLLKTASEQQCQDVDDKISIVKLSQEDIGHCSNFSSDQHSSTSKLHAEVEIKTEPIDMDQESVDSDDMTLANTVAALSQDTEKTLPTHTIKSMVKGEMMEVNRVTSNSTKNIPPPLPPFKRKKQKLPKKKTAPEIAFEAMMKEFDRKIEKKISNVDRIPKDGEAVMYGDVHALTVKVLSESEVQAHRDNTRKARYYIDSKVKCDMCLISFGTQRTYEGHVMKMHDPSAGDFPCNVCQQRFLNDAEMVKHRKTHYIKYMCTKCNYGITELELALKHHDSHHYLKRELERPDADSDSKCEVCGKCLGSSLTLKNHMEIMHKDSIKYPLDKSDQTKHTCEDCGATFGFKEGLTTHRRLKHKIKRT